MIFAHPGNDSFSMSHEAQLYIPEMQDEGCEFIIVSYHGGLGDTDMDLVFGLNSEDQGKRMIEECEGIDLLIVGHDHSTGYSNTFATDRSGKEVLVVNGGGQELTRSVFRFSEDKDGALVWKLAETENLVIDDFDTDKTMTSVTVSGNYTIRPGDISFRDIYRLYRYDNVALVLPMYGREILAVMEENAANRLAVREIWDSAYFYTVNDQFTNIVFGGLNFTYDMSKPAGERVQAEGFSNGRAFDEDGLYLVAVNNYILGNERCGLREYDEEDAIWSQPEEADGETIQDLIAEYISDQCSENGAVTPDNFTWRWSLGYSADPASLAPYEGKKAASLVRRPEDGHTYVIYHEAQGCTFTERETNGGLMLTEAATEGDLSVWKLIKAYGGWYVVNAGARGNQALEYYSGRFTTYELGRSGV